MGRFLLLSAFLFLGVCLVHPAPVINAPWGRVSGRDFTVSGGTASFYGYLGIPYALPPLGERRFSKPQPHPGPGDGRVFNASSKGPICPQQVMLVGVDNPEQNENCLTLSVYTPSSPAAGSSLRPVMVWIHGGGFIFGDAVKYTPGQLVTQGDVIVVIIQYRLGVLGFLSSGDDVASGNWGLMDQSLAIKWVKDNIRAFGGDPDSITIFGESAGGASVGYQLLSPQSRGLFNKAILQSGTPLASWALNKQPRQTMYTLANLTGCARPFDLTPPLWVQWYAQYMSPQYLEFWRHQLHERIVRCLREVAQEKLVENTYLPTGGDGEDFGLFQTSPFVPSVDGDFVPRDPADLVLDPEYLSANGISESDVMIGVNNNEAKMLAGVEGIYVPPKEVLDFIKSDEFVDYIVKDEVKFQYGGQLSRNEAALSALAEVANFFYTKPRQNGEINLQDVADVYSDLYFVTPAVSFARGLAKSEDKLRTTRPQERIGGTFFYLFDHYPAFAEDDLLQGTSHGVDEFYEFDPNPPTISREGFTAEDDELSRTFVSMVTEFATTGNPNNALGRQLGGNTWPEFSVARESYLALAPQPRVEADLYAKRVALWLDLIPTLVNLTYAHDHMTQAMWSLQPMAWSNSMMMQRNADMYNYYIRMKSCM